MTDTDTMRLGHGEFTAPEQVVSFARMYFLDAVDELYPNCRAELEALLPHFEPSPHGHLNGRYTLTTRREAADIMAKLGDRSSLVGPFLSDWCLRWHLTDAADPTRPADWVLRVAYETLATAWLWRQKGSDVSFAWIVSGGGGEPEIPASARPTGLHMQTYANAKCEIPRSPRPELKTAHQQYDDAGWIRTPRKSARRQFEWAAHMIVGNKTAEDIAGPQTRGDLAEEIQRRVADVRKQMCWSRPKGRPVGKSRPAR